MGEDGPFVGLARSPAWQGKVNLDGVVSCILKRVREIDDLYVARSGPGAD
mgnify:CR=1 FL=1